MKRTHLLTAICILGPLLVAPTPGQGAAPGIGMRPLSLVAQRPSFPERSGHGPSPSSAIEFGRPHAGAAQPAAQAPGCTLHVAMDGSDTNDGRSAALAFRTLQRAADSVKPGGDVVCVHAGTYAGFQITRSGADEQKRIIFKSYPGGTAVLDGALGTANSHVIFVHAAYVTIEGFSTTDSTNYPADTTTQIGGITIDDYQTSSHHVRIENNQIHHLTGGGIGPSSGYSSHHIEIINSHIYDVGLARLGYGIYLSGSDNTVRGNRIHDAYGHGIHIYGGVTDRNLIENNLVYHNGRDDYAKGYDWNNCKANGCPYGDGIIDWGGADNVIRNNIVYDNRMAGLTIHSQNDQVYNNTSFGNQGPSSESPGIWVTENRGATIRNNLSYGNASSDFFIGPGNTEDHNLFGVDPKFLNPSNILGSDNIPFTSDDGFHLTPGSPAIDAGIAVSGFSIDFESTSRPQGAGWDLGADEFAAGTAFSDVPPDHWAYPYVEALFQDGYVKGCRETPAREYCPQDVLARAEAAVFVVRGVRGAGFAPPQPGGSAFADVPLSHWGVEWIEQLWQDGFTAGCAADPLAFCPLQPHSRAEGAVFFVRMLRGADFVPPQPSGLFYSDVPLDAWYAKWVAAADAEGLTRECEEPAQRADDRYRPSERLSRAEAACMMAKAKALP